MSNESSETKSDISQAHATKPWLIASTIKRHLVWALPAGILMSIFGACLVLVDVAPEYEATHILQANHDFVLSRDVIDIGKDRAINEIPLIMSPEVLDDVLADPQFKSVPSFSNPELREREIRRRLTVSRGGTDDLLLITYRDSDKFQVAKVANAIAEEYVKERRRFDDLRFRSLEKSLRQPIDQARRNVEDARRLYEDLAKKVYGKNPFATGRESTEGEQSSVGQEIHGIETAELLFAQKRFEQESELFDKLNARFLAVRAEQGRGSSLVTRSLAREPSSPIEDWPLDTMALAACLAFFLPFSLAILVESRRR
ncbi:MAG: hypothetical protein SFV81_16210 [Pirellulaceae bacterium]|nr:hypothetical protein [Pirellulaceae bacterium]